MNAQALIADLTRRGVELAVNADRLRWRAPKGTVGPDELAAMLNHKAEIIDLLSRRQGDGRTDPKGDTPAAWRVWYRALIQHHNRLGRDDDLAGSLAWGEAESVWHLKHGTTPNQSTCAGCGGLLSGRERLILSDGAAVHWDEGAGFDCLAAHGTRWRADATAGLTALGLEPPNELSTKET